MPLRPMSDRYRRPAWVRRLNLMADATGGAAAMVPIEADELLESAVAAAGHDVTDLGDGDWEGRFRRLVDAVDDNDLHVVGRMLTREELLR